MPDYVPSKIADRMTWLTNFKVFMAAHYADVGLTASDNLAVSDAVGLAEVAYGLSSVNETRTPSTIADTQTKMNAAVATCRVYAQLMNNFAGTTDEYRSAAAITIRDTGKTAITAPTSYPVLAIDAATPLQHKMRYSDSGALSPKVKRRPFGAIALELRMSVGAAPPASPLIAPFVGLISRAPFAVDHDPADVGQTAYYYARWVTAKGLTGPWSPLASMTIAA